MMHALFLLRILKAKIFFRTSGGVTLIEIESSLIELKIFLIELKCSLIQFESSLIKLKSSLYICIIKERTN